MNEKRQWDNRTKGWFWIDNGLIDNFAPKIGAYAVAVYCYLCRRADLKSQECFPAISTISDSLSIGRNTVKRALEILTEHGLVFSEPRVVEGQGMSSNTYTLLDPPLLSSGHPGPIGATPWPCEDHTPGPIGATKVNSCFKVDSLNTGYDTKISEQPRINPDLHLEQDTLRWMEDVWRYYCKRLGKFDQPRFEINKLEDRVVKEVFRIKWFENCASAEPDRTNLWLKKISQEFPSSGYRAPKSVKVNPYDKWLDDKLKENERNGIQQTSKAS